MASYYKSKRPHFRRIWSTRQYMNEHRQCENSWRTHSEYTTANSNGGTDVRTKRGDKRPHTPSIQNTPFRLSVGCGGTYGRLHIRRRRRRRFDSTRNELGCLELCMNKWMWLRFPRFHTLFRIANHYFSLKIPRDELRTDWMAIFFSRAGRDKFRFHKRQAKFTIIEHNLMCGSVTIGGQWPISPNANDDETHRTFKFSGCASFVFHLRCIRFIENFVRIHTSTLFSIRMRCDEKWRRTKNNAWIDKEPTRWWCTCWE